MDVGAIVASVAGSLGGTSSLVRLYRRRSHRLRAEIDANRELAAKYPEGSPEREALEAVGRLMIQDYGNKSVDRLTKTRSWNWASIVFALLGAGGFTYGALAFDIVWVSVLMWVGAALMVISVLGQLTSSEKTPELDESAEANEHPRST